MTLSNFHSRPPARMTREMHTLRHRQCRQLMPRTLAEFGAMERLAARVLIPSTKAMAFDHPFPLVSTAIVVLISYHRCESSNGRTYYQAFFRGYRGRFCQETRQTEWGAGAPGGAVFAHDLNLCMFCGARGKLLSLDEMVLARVGLDLDRHCLRQADNWFPVSGPPLLPTTMLAYPRGTKCEPQHTPYVAIHARNAGIDWESAWRALFSIMHVDADQSGLGVELIDTRIHAGLRGAEGKPLWLGERLDLRAMLGRPCYNPARHLTDESADEAAIVTAMRRLLDDSVSRACTDAELLRAFENPAGPLMLSKCCRIQVWRPSEHAAEPDGFIFADPGLHADLWHVREAWERRFRAGMIRPMRSAA